MRLEHHFLGDKHTFIGGGTFTSGSILANLGCGMDQILVPYFERVSSHTTGLTVLSRVAPVRLPTCFLTLLLCQLGLFGQPTKLSDCLCGMRLWQWLFIIGLWKLVKNVCQVRLHGVWMKDAAFSCTQKTGASARLEPKGVCHTSAQHLRQKCGARGVRTVTLLTRALVSSVTVSALHLRTLPQGS